MKLENMFVKHYAPNHMFAPKDNKGTIHLGHNLANTLILAQAFHQIFCSQGPLWVKCLNLKRGIIQSNVHRIQ